MQVIDTHTLELMEGWFNIDSTVRFRANFALHGGNGAERSSVVVIVLEPGEALGQHTDSAEEVLLVVGGNVEIQVAGDRVRARQGTLAVVPPMAPHSIRNVGSETARVIGFFPSPTVISAFAEPIQPMNEAILVFGGASMVPSFASDDYRLSRL
jgi:quercetin dioxygenase-like cupin family protein